MKKLFDPLFLFMILIVVTSTILAWHSKLDKDSYNVYTFFIIGSYLFYKLICKTFNIEDKKWEKS